MFRTRFLRKLFLYFVSFAIPLLMASQAAADKQLTYRLKWLINMSTVGDMVALEQGFFSRAGLTVNIKPGGPERDAIRELELGYADFGVASADQVIQALAKGAPIVVIAQLFQTNPLQWIYFKDKVQLNSLQDLKGKTIGVTFGKNDEFIMRTMLAKVHLTDEQVRLYSVRLDFSPFFQRRVDCWPVYINTQGIDIGKRLAAAGEKFDFINPAEYGVRFVANSVVTSKRLVDQNPAMVDQFLKALLQGWKTAIDPAAAQTAISIVGKYDRNTNKDSLSEQLSKTRSLIQPPGGKPIGYIDGSGWEQTEQIMLTNGQIERPVNVRKYLLVR